MIFVTHPGQGPTIHMVPIRAPSGQDEVIDARSIRVYLALAGGVITICIDATLKTGENTMLVGTIGQFEQVAGVGEIMAQAVASQGATLIGRAGENLDEVAVASEDLSLMAPVGLDEDAQVQQVEFTAMAGGIDASAQVTQVNYKAQGGGPFEGEARVC